MQSVSVVRLQLLRAMYLVIAIGLMIIIWPKILVPGDVSLSGSVVRAMLGTVALLSLLGLRYPLQMLPILLFEFAWKTLWVIAFGLGPWLAGEIDPSQRKTLMECLMGLVMLTIAIPWGYVFSHYVKAAGMPWTAGKEQIGA